MTVTIKGQATLTGSPEVILSVMQEARYFDAPKGEEYIQTVVADVDRCFGIKLQVEGETYQERAESLLKELAKHDMVKIEEEK